MNWNDRYRFLPVAILGTVMLMISISRWMWHWLSSRSGVGMGSAVVGTVAFSLIFCLSLLLSLLVVELIHQTQKRRHIREEDERMMGRIRDMFDAEGRKDV